MTTRVSSEGRLIVISAASGAGKSTLTRMLMARRRTAAFSISVTTRMPRPGEKDGRDYFFVTEAAFKAMRDRKELVEWAEVHGNFYGTPKAFLDRQRAAGKDVLLDIDVQGALKVKKDFPDAVLIFITTPTFEELERRLRGRCSEGEVEIQRRLATARRELRAVNQYDYEVVNDQIPKALRGLEAILDAERLRIGANQKTKKTRRNHNG